MNCQGFSRPAFALSLVMLACACRAERDPLPEFPQVVLYAWERPERMDFLDPKLAAVAFLARTVSWDDVRVASRPRLQPLDVPSGTAVMAVVRLESRGSVLPDTTVVTREILAAATTHTIRALQLDFDATRSQRNWYAKLIDEVRRKLSPTLPLSITAFASWCEQDRWMQGLPVSEAVPMLYRMGRYERHDVSDFREPMCETGVAISTDEAPESVPSDRRIFVFHPRAWDRDAYLQVMQFVGRRG